MDDREIRVRARIERIDGHKCERKRGHYCSDCIRGKRNPVVNRHKSSIRKEIECGVRPEKSAKLSPLELKIERIRDRLHVWSWMVIWASLEDLPLHERFARTVVASAAPIPDDKILPVWETVKAIRRAMANADTVAKRDAAVQKAMRIIQERLGIRIKLRAWELDAMLAAV